MRILIANDDGIYSPGIATLAEVAKNSATCGLWLRMSSNLPPDMPSQPCDRSLISVLRSGILKLTGSTARPQTVLRWESTIGRKWTLSFSGINLGSNLGNSMWHSGTLAAAKQAALLGSRGIALSATVIRDEPKLEILKSSLEKVLALLLQSRDLSFVNVNFPDGRQRVCAGHANRCAL